MYLKAAVFGGIALMSAAGLLMASPSLRSPPRHRRCSLISVDLTTAGVGPASEYGCFVKGLLHDLLGNAFFVGSAVLLSALLVTFLSPWVAFAAMAVLWLPLIGLAPEGYRRLTGQEIELHWVMILAVFAPIYGVTAYLPDLVTMLTVPAVTDARASDIPRHPEAVRFDFTDAKVQTSLAWLRTTRTYDARKSTTTVTHTLVAPLTDAAWTPQQPVPAWAVCTHAHAYAERCPDWAWENGGAIVPAPRFDAATRAGLVTEAATKKGLQTLPDARLLVWGESSALLVTKRVVVLLACTLGGYVAWALGYSAVFAYRRLRSR